MADEKIEVAIAVVVDKSASSAPTNLVIVNAGFTSDVRECSVAVIVKKNVVAPETAEKVVEAVVVVITDADTSLPSSTGEPRFFCDVSECAVAIIFEKLRSRRFPVRPLFA